MIKESTIPEIADLLNIKVPKANELVTILLSEGLVIESGHKSEGIGRKATTYILNKDSCYFLGVEIKNTPSILPRWDSTNQLKKVA